MATLSAAALASPPPGASSAAAAPSARPSESPRASPNVAQVRFLSPVIEIDAEAGLALLKVRDAENGDVRFQLPPERVVREYKSVEAATNPPSAETTRGAPPAVTAAEAAAASSLTSADPAGAKQA